MKQKIYIAVLLAGMLALAGCGGGGSAEPVVNDPPLSQADCDAGTIFSEGACLTQEEIAAATAQAEAQAKAMYLASQKTAIAGANDAAAVDEIITALDNDKLTAAGLSELQSDARKRKADIATGIAEQQEETDRNNQNDDLTRTSGVLATAISNAQGEGNDVTQDLIDAVTTARNNLQTAITGATLVDDTSSYAGEVTSATSTLQIWKRGCLKLQT